jgi:N-acetylglucosaminyldiphosphoundecaprenol N-acetyl-beta-D-mannosaminyltransferase
MPKVDVLGVKVDVLEKAELEYAIGESIRLRRKDVYAYANIHGINIAQKDESFRRFLNESAVVYCDGQGVRLGARILGHRLPARIVLTYWIWELCALCESNGYTLFFLGGTETAVERAVQNISARFPRIRIVGRHHGYFEKKGIENDRIIEMIVKLCPNILFVGFGMPMQEHWIGANIHRLCANAILPAGSMIDYAAGLRATAPSWMAENGLEWLHRLVQEPSRLWKRYVLGNPSFMFRILFQRSQSGKRR